MINFSKQYHLQASQENYEEHLRLNPGDDLDEMGQLLYRLNYLARKCELFCERLQKVQENKNNKVYVISTWCPDGEQVTVVVEPTYPDAMKHIHKSLHGNNNTKVREANWNMRGKIFQNRPLLNDEYYEQNEQRNGDDTH